MPGGSNYPGPEEALEQYKQAVTASKCDSDVKGAKNPYTSLNGHMFSFLDFEGRIALRLSEELREEFFAKYDSGLVVHYGSVMRGYVHIPGDLFEDIDELATWFTKSFDWIGTLKPKPTKKP